MSIQLNSEQSQAVKETANGGPVLILSGAGTGKTRVLTAAIWQIVLFEQKVKPWEVLALTFTNKAANEMKQRLIEQMPPSHGSFDWVGTFHSICLRILRYNSGRKDFLVFGEDEQKTVLKSVIIDLGLDLKKENPAGWVEKISSIKDKGIQSTGHEDRRTPARGADKIFNAYQAELARLNAIDFGDIILKVLELFIAQPDILRRYQQQFKYVLVDEFQDTNIAQMQLLTMLFSGNICCVGDDDQSIYSWRGAEIKNILEFEKTFPKAKIIRLETNYRSTGAILAAANRLISNNKGRLGKDLRTDLGDGEPVKIITCASDFDEARIIADEIESAGRWDQQAHTRSTNLSNFAILIRAGALSRAFEEEFAHRRIPYKLVGAQKFYDRMEIRDTIAYTRLLVYPFDDLSFLRIISKPRRGFGPAAIASLPKGLPLFEAAAAHKNGAKFRDAFDFNWSEIRPEEAARNLLERSGYLQMWRESKDLDAADRLENIDDLLNSIVAKYDSLEEFLEHASLMIAEDDPSSLRSGSASRADLGNAVSIMTIHAAKGLEFDTVFLPAWEEGIFPNEQSVREGNIEEERRLAYVALTRARRRAVITHAMSRMQYGQWQNNPASRFIGELGVKDERIKKQTDKLIHPFVHMPFRLSSMVGKLVRHTELGQGVVIEDDGDILTVAFKARGIKKVDRRFIQFL